MNNEVLRQIAICLNKSGVLWGVGGSTLLRENGIIDDPADLDVIIDFNAREKVLRILDQAAERIHTQTKAPFRTACFQKYIYEGTSIDVMADFTIEHEKGIYKMLFDAESISKTISMEGVPTPFTSLEDWYILYQLIPNKGGKAELIESYWKKHGIEYPAILERALKQPLPNDIQKRSVHALLQMR